MADWLKPVFSRNPRYNAQGVPTTDRPASFSIDDKTDTEDIVTLRLRPSDRVSSYIGLRPSTPSAPLLLDPFPNVRHPASVYHAPSVDQLAETLKVVMMNQ